MKILLNLINKYCKAGIFLFVSSIVLVSCAPNNENNISKEELIDTVTNEEKVFNISLGSGQSQVKKELGQSEDATREKWIFEDEKLQVGFDKEKVVYFSSDNPRLQTDQGIQIGSSKNKILKEYKDLDLYEYHAPDETEKYWIFMDFNDYKIVYELIENKVSKIKIGTTDFYTLIYDGDSNDIIEDEELINSSEYLSFIVNRNLNNSRVTDPEFKEYVNFGLLKGVPVPIGMNYQELTNRFGLASYQWESKEYGNSYWYKNFNCSFIVDPEKKVVTGIQCPIDMDKEELLETLGQPSSTENVGKQERIDRIVYENQEHKVSFYTSPNEELKLEFFIIEANK